MRILLLIALPALVAPAGLHATSLEVCNRGAIKVYYATAERQGNFLFGYKWVVEGWYTISPGDCENVYHRDSGTRGDTHVVLTYTDSKGKLQAIPFANNNDDQLKRSGKPLCVATEAFNYTLGDGDLGGSCKPGYFSVPAAIYLEPLDDEFCDSFGNCVGGGFEKHKYTIPNGATAGDAQGSQASAPVPSSAESSDAPTTLDFLKRLGTEIQASRQRQQRELVRVSVAAAATGFESYKQGAGREANGVRMWTVSAKPAQTNGCTVIEATTGIGFECDLHSSSSRPEVEAYYAEWVTSAIAAFPQDWQPVDNGIRDIKAFRAASGLTSSIWIEQHSEIGQYVLFFVVSAARAAPKSPDPPAAPESDPSGYDDLIGHGGQIQRPAWFTEKKVDVCVPRNLVENQAWEKPVPDSKMDKFKDAVRNLILAQGREGIQFRVRDVLDAYDPSRTDPRGLVDEVNTSQGCPGTYYGYTMKIGR